MFHKVCSSIEKLHTLGLSVKIRYFWKKKNCKLRNFAKYIFLKNSEHKYYFILFILLLVIPMTVSTDILSKKNMKHFIKKMQYFLSSEIDFFKKLFFYEISLFPVFSKILKEKTFFLIFCLVYEKNP